MFITFEGGEGSGKTTIIEKVCEFFEKQGKEIVLTREPGGTNISEQIRNVILDRKNTEMDGMTEAYLYAAARRQHVVEKIAPALEAGKLVISDRYVDSSIVYQGFVRGFGVYKIADINKEAMNYNGKDYLPDITFYFDLDPEIGLARISKNKNREVNRLDVEKMDFHQKVREGYLKWAQKNPDRIIVINADQGIEKLANDIIMEIAKRITD